MGRRNIREVDHDAWLENEMEKNCHDKGDDRYEIIKKWRGYSDEEMEEVDLDSEWDDYLDYQVELEAECRAEARAEAMIERMESRADYY